MGNSKKPDHLIFVKVANRSGNILFFHNSERRTKVSNRNWLPGIWGGDTDDTSDPFGALRRQMDSMFDDFGKNLSAASEGIPVRSNVSETETEICITAELPGIGIEDVEVSIEGNRISVSGQKVSEEEEKKDDDGRQFRRIERTSGSFQRVMLLPFDIDPDSVKAQAKDGVLTVTIPKPAEQVAKAKKIKIESIS